MKIEIRKRESGNCGCRYCKKTQEGLKYHPYTVYHKADNEKRGHNEPVCSIECAKALANQLRVEA